MSMFPHTITLYHETEDPVTFEPSVAITVLQGVLVDASRGANLRESGLENADAVNVYIPFEVRATDGTTLLNKRYISPKEYELAADKSELWTLDERHDFFVKGEVVIEGKDYQYMNTAYDDVYRITKVDNKDFGGLKHFEVGGR